MIPTPRTVLVGVDFSESGERAQERALALASGWGAEIVLHHVIQSSLWEDLRDDADDSDQPTPEQAQTRALAALQPRAEVAAQLHGLRCRAQVSIGRAAHALAAAVEACGAQLLVVGSHGERSIRDAVLGSTAQKLTRLSPCPVLVIKRPLESPYRTVLAPTDFSPASRAALRLALSWLPGATVHVAHAFELPYDGMARFAGIDDEIMSGYHRRAAARLRVQMQAFVDHCRPVPGACVTLVVHGHAASFIGRWVRDVDADVVVIAARGKSETERAFLGSVSLDAVQQAACDVLLVRGLAEQAA